MTLCARKKTILSSTVLIDSDKIWELKIKVMKLNLFYSISITGLSEAHWHSHKTP